MYGSTSRNLDDQSLATNLSFDLGFNRASEGELVIYSHNEWLHTQWGSLL